MPESVIRVTLSIEWALNGVFRLNLKSNIGRIFYFRMIFESILVMMINNKTLLWNLNATYMGRCIVKVPDDISIIN